MKRNMKGRITAFGPRHAKGVAPDFPYKEPEALTDILSQAAALPELGPTVSGKTYRQRIAGAFRGRCAAVGFGQAPGNGHGS